MDSHHIVAALRTSWLCCHTAQRAKKAPDAKKGARAIRHSIEVVPVTPPSHDSARHVPRAQVPGRASLDGAPYLSLSISCRGWPPPTIPPWDYGRSRWAPRLGTSRRPRKARPGGSKSSRFQRRFALQLCPDSATARVDSTVYELAQGLLLLTPGV